MSVTEFKLFLQTIRGNQVVIEAIRSFSARYSIKQYKINDLTIKGAEQMFEGIHQKFYSKHGQKSNMKWLENQLKIFVWCLSCYIYIHKCGILDLIQQDWQKFSKIFNEKSLDLFYYQAQLIVECSNKPRPWEMQQDRFLSQVMKQKGSGSKWNQISKEFFLKSKKKYNRSPKQCYQRWNNHIDPEKVKGSWKIEECLKMFQFVKQNGKKWARIVKLLDNLRDQHSVKNKFNSLFRKQKRTIPIRTEREIYDIIIFRLKRAMCNQGAYSTFEELEDESKSGDNDRPLTFSEGLRKKLMGCNFDSKKNKDTDYPIGSTNKLEMTERRQKDFFDYPTFKSNSDWDRRNIQQQNEKSLVQQNIIEQDSGDYILPLQML